MSKAIYPGVCLDEKYLAVCPAAFLASRHLPRPTLPSASRVARGGRRNRPHLPDFISVFHGPSTAWRTSLPLGGPGRLRWQPVAANRMKAIIPYSLVKRLHRKTISADTFLSRFFGRRPAFQLMYGALLAFAL